MVYHLLKYFKSHIYELHALAAGTLAFLMMFWVKKPVKEEIRAYAERKARENPRWKEKKSTYVRRMGMVLIFLDVILSGAFFGVISVLSPLIQYSFPMTILSGILSLTLYAVYDQLISGRKKDRL